MLFVSALVIPILGFFLQSYPRFFNKYFGVDVWTRLLEIDQVKKAHHKIPGRITKGFIIDGFFDYPPVFPFIFSFFPKDFLLKKQGFIAPFFDAIQNVVVFFIAMQITHNPAVAFLSQAIYGLTPIISIENSYLTPRSLGYLLFTLSFYPLLVFHTTHQPQLLFVSIFFTILLFLTHRFALQAFLFTAVFFAIYDKSAIYIFVPIIGFLGAILVTKGYYLRVAKGHLSNIYFWVINYQDRFSHQIYGRKNKQKSDWVGKIYGLLSTFSPVFLFGLNIWLFSGFVYFYLIYFTNFSIIKTPVLVSMSVWILSLYVLAAIVLKVKWLIPIGEGQRYLEMCTVPSSILSAVLFFFFYNRFGIIVVFVLSLMLIENLLLIITIQIKGIIKDKNRSLTQNIIEAYSYINKLSGTPRIMCIPHQITTMTVYHTKADILVNADNPRLLKLSDFFPVVKKPIEEIIKKYSLDYILLRENFAKLSDLHIKNPKVVFRADDILLLKVG